MSHPRIGSQATVNPVGGGPQQQDPWAMGEEIMPNDFFKVRAVVPSLPIHPLFLPVSVTSMPPTQTQM